MHGLGLGAVCGDNPCTWIDAIYARDACLNYKLCATPNDPATILESKGLIAGSGTVLGSTANQVIQNFTDTLLSNPDGSISWASVAMLGIAGFLGLRILKIV